MAADKFYITTPIYYVNDKPHIGHAYTTILADVLARYHRLIGVPTHFLTGTDEHGQKVAKAAEANGCTPQEQADTTVVRFQALWEKLDITHDDFIRTTEERHKVVVQQILQELFDRGEIYKDEYDGWYCTPCERFYTEKDLEEGNCPECKRAVDHITESNYFFRMSNYKEWLVDYIEQNPTFIQPDFRRNETLGFLRKDLNDLCISRPKSRLSWGIELPFDTDFVTYVWFDALVNYISAPGYLSDESSFDKWWPADIHLIGKDILTTHTVYWPTMLQAMGLPQAKTIFAHGWWLIGRDKMSKSLGNVVDPMSFAENYGVDAFRYFLMAEMSVGQDASFTDDAFRRRYNAELANDLGNMLSRVAKMINSYCDGIVPQCGEMADEDLALRETTLAAAAAMVKHVESMRIDLGIAEIAGAVRAANRYLEQRQPWTLAKQDDAASRTLLATTLYNAAEAMRIVSGMLYPVMPNKMAEFRAVLGCPQGEPDYALLREWGHLASGNALGESKVLFPRIQPPKEEQATKVTAKSSAKGKGKAAEGVALIEFTDFTKVQLCTGKVLEAENVQDADKLLRLQVELGKETRQIVAGIAKFYDPADLIGKQVVVVANLKPAVIRGVESSGMLLAASTRKRLRLVTVDGDDIPSGAQVG